MALNGTIALGGGAAHSGTATPGSYAMAECDTCGAEAITLYRGWVPMCYSCEKNARETEEEVHAARDAEEQQRRWEWIREVEWCEDCGEEEPTHRFLHLDGRAFRLCESCFYGADHEPDYLMFCECAVPEWGRWARDDSCQKCLFRIRSREEQEQEDYYEEDNGFTFDFLDHEDEDGPPPPSDQPCYCPVPCRDVVNEGKCYLCKGNV